MQFFWKSAPLCLTSQNFVLNSILTHEFTINLIIYLLKRILGETLDLNYDNDSTIFVILKFYKLYKIFIKDLISKSITSNNSTCNKTYPKTFN